MLVLGNHYIKFSLKIDSRLQHIIKKYNKIKTFETENLYNLEMIRVHNENFTVKQNYNLADIRQILCTMRYSALSRDKIGFKPIKLMDN